MSAKQPLLSRETFQFFRELGRNNHKDWMDENRERYRTVVVEPFRRLLEELAPAVLRLDHRFHTAGRGNFSRINRDIRFAKDKTPYRTHMYLKFTAPFAGEGETGELYLGVSQEAVTVGFRIYGGSKRKDSALVQIAEPRLAAKPAWLGQQKTRLGRRYQSYWYMAEKGQWTQRDGWPTAANWKKLQGWIIRRKLAPSAVQRNTFPKEVQKIFRDVFPILRFTSLPD